MTSIPLAMGSLEKVRLPGSSHNNLKRELPAHPQTVKNIKPGLGPPG